MSTTTNNTATPEPVYATATNAIVFGLDENSIEGFIGLELRYLMEMFEKKNISTYVPELSIYCFSFENPPTNFNNIKERVHVSFKDMKNTVVEDVIRKASLKILNNKKVPYAACYKQMVEYAENGEYKVGLGITFRNFDGQYVAGGIVPADKSQGVYELDFENYIERNGDMDIDADKKFFKILKGQLGALMTEMQKVQPELFESMGASQ